MRHFKGDSQISQDTGRRDTLEEACHAQSPNLQIFQIKSSQINGILGLFDLFVDVLSRFL